MQTPKDEQHLSDFDEPLNFDDSLVSRCQITLRNLNLFL